MGIKELRNVAFEQRERLKIAPLSFFLPLFVVISRHHHFLHTALLLGYFMALCLFLSQISALAVFHLLLHDRLIRWAKNIPFTSHQSCIDDISQILPLVKWFLSFSIFIQITLVFKLGCAHTVCHLSCFSTCGFPYP